MNILIKDAMIIHEGSENHLMKKDILICEGRIEKISDQIHSDDAKLIEGESLYCCIGLCDIGCQTGEPGFEHRETMNSLTSAALAGGYTALALFPTNKPVTQTKADIHFLVNHPDRQGVEIIAIGALSKDCKGNDITEYIDMSSAGVMAFSDGMKSVENTGLLNRALQYSKQFGGIIIHHPDDHALSGSGEMNEGVTSTALGLPGVPDIAEIHFVQRDILINGYNESNLIEHCISLKKSVDEIRSAKMVQKELSSTVAYMNLICTDEDLNDFDTNYKVLPVLRTEIDRLGLIEGIKEGVIDAIVSNHVPLDEEVKKLEFPYSAAGATGLETCLSACITILKNKVDIATLVHTMTINPRRLLKLDIPVIEMGHEANLCIFDTGVKHTYHETKSKSANNPFLGNPFDVKVVATIIGENYNFI